MTRLLSDYRTHVFDLDGVLLASNNVKSEAFYKTALPYGEENANKMVALHQTAGSISRQDRWVRFFKEILQREPSPGELKEVVAICSGFVREGVFTAPLLPGVIEYLCSLNSKKMIVSGIEHAELQEIVKAHRLDLYTAYAFGGLPGVLKSERLTDLILCGLIEPPAVYYGDTADDHLSAENAKMDFVWIYGNSEFVEGREYFRDKIPADRLIENFTFLVGAPV